MRRDFSIVLIVLDVLMLVCVIVYALTDKRFTPLVTGLWVSNCLIAHIQQLEEDR